MPYRVVRDLPFADVPSFLLELKKSGAQPSNGADEPKLVTLGPRLDGVSFRKIPFRYDSCSRWAVNVENKQMIDSALRRRPDAVQEMACGNSMKHSPGSPTRSS
jgi:hypothetical protein